MSLPVKNIEEAMKLKSDMTLYGAAYVNTRGERVDPRHVRSIGPVLVTVGGTNVDVPEPNVRWKP